LSLVGLAAAVLNANEGVSPAVVAALTAAGAKAVVDRAPDGAQVAAVGEMGEDPSAFLDRCEAAVGPLDILVIGSGLVRSQPMSEVDPAEFQRAIERELVFPALLMRDAARRMASRGAGRIVALGSMSGKTGVHHNTAPAAASKGGLFAFTRALAAEVAEHGVTVNAVATALFEPQTRSMTDEKRSKLRGAIPVGRFGKSEEAAHAVLYLVDPLAGYVTGECLNLSGGRFMD
jgi:3-oxoacyl-[acyl-carrier protein] reductase